MKTLVFALVGLALSVFALAAPAVAAPAPDSKRLALAKDYIADEQWSRAIIELRAVASDANDPNRAEALFWLAHSEHQVGDQGSAISTIARLERLFPRSPWVRPAQSLRVEIAQRLNRDDVLWVLAVPPSAPQVATPGVPSAPAALAPMPPPGSTAPPRRAPGAWGTKSPDQPSPPPTPMSPTPMPSTLLPPATPPAAAPPTMIVHGRPPASPRSATPEGLMPMTPYVVDTDTRIEALVGLLDSHSERVIPLLREIALDGKNPYEARRAVFALAQSPRPEARKTVVEAASRGPNVVRIAAIRELGRFPEAAFTTTLAGIAKIEADPAVRDTAIVTLGRSGARMQLRTLYGQLPTAARFSVITALFNARDDDELIRIATHERDQRLRTSARQQLRLLATPKAIKYLTDNP